VRPTQKCTSVLPTHMRFPTPYVASETTRATKVCNLSPNLPAPEAKPFRRGPVTGSHAQQFMHCCATFCQGKTFGNSLGIARMHVAQKQLYPNPRCQAQQVGLPMTCSPTLETPRGLGREILHNAWHVMLCHHSGHAPRITLFQSHRRKERHLYRCLNTRAALPTAFQVLPHIRASTGLPTSSRTCTAKACVPACFCSPAAASQHHEGTGRTTDVMPACYGSCVQNYSKPAPTAADHTLLISCATHKHTSHIIDPASTAANLAPATALLLGGWQFQLRKHGVHVGQAHAKLGSPNLNPNTLQHTTQKGFTRHRQKGHSSRLPPNLSKQVAAHAYAPQLGSQCHKKTSSQILQHQPGAKLESTMQSDDPARQAHTSCTSAMYSCKALCHAPMLAMQPFQCRQQLQTMQKPKWNYLPICHSASQLCRLQASNKTHPFRMRWQKYSPQGCSSQLFLPGGSDMQLLCCSPQLPLLQHCIGSWTQQKQTCTAEHLHMIARIQ
jgi:hypothetical protein